MTQGIQVRVNSYGPGRGLSLVYVDPISGRKVAKSVARVAKDLGITIANPDSRKEAERVAGSWETVLNSGKYQPPGRITWLEFRERYETERLAILSESVRAATGSAFNHLERVLNPDRLAKLTTAAVSGFAAKLRSERMRESTLGTHLRHLKAALNWAEKMGLLAAAPHFDMPRPGESKGRPITTEEYERMVQAVPKVRPQDAAQWERLLTGLWLSGLRLGEALVVSWDQDAPFAVDLSGRFPAFRIEARAQKGRRDERLPMTPDFAEWLLATTPEPERTGQVFPVATLAGQPMTVNRAGRIIARIGRAAGIVVAKDEAGEVKYATAHDLRRSFCTRWAKRVMPAVLQRLMRHRNIGTTMKYYVGIEADDVAADLWAKHGFGNILGNNRSQAAGKAEAADGAAMSEGDCRQSFRT